ncbi:MAG: DNA phosphorothioation-associated putative methyltransferase [Stigonema ocellatum SAG 48.90 = DSM 106950]|nr:DNA phosphorothioation-associated putative methyltransferase [Stigonema ocellatum SAG 48.90 = DSM 106950]
MSSNIMHLDNNSHLAALHRKRLSSTARLILKRGLLSNDETFLDYGCGRGFDFQALESRGYNSVGYDPYYFPDTELKPADVVMFSYVLNVLQSPQERRESLLHAWSLTRKRIVIAAVVRGKAIIDDGAFTKIGTFAKEWKHIELKAFIETNLGHEAIRLDKDKFLVERSGRQFTPLHYEEVMERVSAIALSGWVAPMGVIIKGYCTNFRPRAGFDNIDDGEFPGRIRYYRLLGRTKCLPGKNGQPVRVLHLRGGIGSEHMEWAMS